MQSLLIIAHGSRRDASNEEVRQLTQQVAEKAGKQYASVSCAFLELAEPSISEGIQHCVQQGVKEIMIIPYFLSAGRHVVKDIPEEVTAAQNLYPDINIKVSPHLGTTSNMVDVLLSLAK